MRSLDALFQMRKALAAKQPSIGSWMQHPDASLAEIMGRAMYDRVAIDMEFVPFRNTNFPIYFAPWSLVAL